MSAFQKAAASQLVHRHLMALVSEARSSGIGLDDLTLELAAHANCAALSFWSEDELHDLLEAAAAQTDQLGHQARRASPPSGYA